MRGAGDEETARIGVLALTDMQDRQMEEKETQ